MPLLGFGTWQLKRDEAVKATSAALEAGYRHVDTATVYGNEAEVGRALHDSGLARGDVFVTTKCPPRLVGQELDTLKRSLDLLGSDYVDLWLIHWPTDTATSLEMWGAFIEARESGLARDIGVSNFGVDMIDERDVRDGPRARRQPGRMESTALRRTGARSDIVRGASPSRATAPFAAEPSSTRRLCGSHKAQDVRRPRSSSAGIFSTA